MCLPPYGTSSSCSTTPSNTQYNIQTSNWLDKTSPTGVTQPVPTALGGVYGMDHSHKAFKGQLSVPPERFCGGDCQCIPNG